jgi:hypothetical protein
MLFGKFAMARMPYSGRIPGSKLHPYSWNKIYIPTKITSKIWTLSKWKICGQIAPTTLLTKLGNLLIRNSKWQWTVTCNIGNKILPKGESKKAQTKTFSDGDTHLMEASLSRRDTLLRRNSITFRNMASRQQYENPNTGPKSLLSSRFYFRTRS